MTQKIFVFGTLKKDFPLHGYLAKASFLGPCQTVEPFPMLVAGPNFAPMMFDEPGTGLRVAGELYRVGESTLAELDGIESVGMPGNWRLPLKVLPIEGEREIAAFAYMKSRDLARPVHSGYLADYQDRRFIPFDRFSQDPGLAAEAGKSAAREALFLRRRHWRESNEEGN